MGCFVISVNTESLNVCKFLKSKQKVYIKSYLYYILCNIKSISGVGGGNEHL